MADKILKVKLQQAYDSEGNWSSKNPTLLKGQMAISSDKSGMYKIGDGTNTWGALPYNTALNAHTLATARTINGTSFNGAGNITTANWGTSRTITIGKSEKAINGSANIEYSLAEIGAFPAAGGNVSGDITFSSVSTTKIGMKGTMASNDMWSIVGGGEASDDGYLEIATGDNGSEPIYFRQYTGAAPWSTDAAVKRTLTLLDESGNTTIPGKLTVAGAITGTLTGNASSATKATQDSAGQQINTTYVKGLSVSGKVITYTRGDGTTATITTQDTNTTYTAGAGLALSGTTFAHANAITAGNVGASANAALGFGGTFTVPYVAYDAQGHIITVANKTMTMPANPNTDTKVTNTLATTTKAYLTGTATATTNTGTQVFDTGVYLGTVAGNLHATQFNGNLVGNVTGNVSGSSGSTTGNAATATKLSTARTIAISSGATGTATAFDGSGNITIPITALDVSKANAGTLPLARGGTGGTSAATAFTNIVAPGGTLSGLLKHKSSSGYTSTPIYIQPGDTNGDALLVTAGGLSVFGSGEFPQNYYGTGEVAATSEQLILGSDQNIYFYSAGQTMADRMGMLWDTSGSLRPNTNNTRSLGSSSYKWNTAYITTIYGNLTGNADSSNTATKLTTARTIGTSGGATGTATSFNGTANITIPITALDMSKANAGTLPVARGGTGGTTAQAASYVPKAFVIGTQTAATGTWTGTLNLPAIYHGLTIQYYLPYAGSGNATLNLNLSGGGTTGAKNCYFSGTSRLTTHFAAGNVIHLTYLENVAISGSTTLYTGWWAQSNYDSNEYSGTRYYAYVYAVAACTSGKLIVGTDSGYQDMTKNVAFDIRYPILHCGTTLAAAASGYNNRHQWYNVNPVTTDAAFTTRTTRRPVYLKGKLTGTSFVPFNGQFLTQTVPTSTDGYHYMLIGYLSGSTSGSTTQMYLYPDHPIFEYKNGSFKLHSDDAARLTAIETEVAETKKSVSDGKTSIAAAITAKKVTTAATDTFAKMAENINKIAIASGNATIGDVLTGKTFTNDGGVQVTGTMANNGSVSQTLNAGGSYTIPAGYHNGSGKVTGNALSGQTSATATAAQILVSQTAWVNGSKLTGTMVNRGAVSQALAINGTYTIPAGYHNGSGKVTQSITTLAGQTITPKAAAQTVSSSGKYMTGNVVINGDAKLIAANIKSGVSIFGVSGTMKDYSYLAVAQTSF